MATRNLKTLLFVILFFIKRVHTECTLVNKNDNNCHADLVCINSFDNLVTNARLWQCVARNDRRCEWRRYSHYENKYECTDNYIYKTDFTLDLVLNNILDINSFSRWKDGSAITDRITKITLEYYDGESIPNTPKLPNVIALKATNLKLEKVNFVFNNLDNIKIVNVSHNSISVMEKDPSANPKIETIDLSYNLITSIPDSYFVHLWRLQNLYLSHNLISKLDILAFEGLSQLQVLDLSHNQLLEIGYNFARFVNIRELYLGNNNLTSILEPNFKMTKLEKLDLSSNRLNNFEETSFGALTDLEYLNLSNNNLTEITNTIFQNNTKLTHLSLSNNNIIKIHADAFEGKHITEFNICNNNFKGAIETKSFAGIDVDVLDLSNYEINSLDDEAFAGLQARVLNLSHNELTNISNTSFKSVHYLTKLDLSKNNLSHFSFDVSDLQNLTDLNVQNNSIVLVASGSIRNLTNLINLDLSYNKISNLQPQTFLNVSKLESLDLCFNPLNSVFANMFQGLMALKKLNLKFTKIKLYENDTFSGLNSLNTLNASHGVLTDIAFNAFEGTSSLAVLDLSHNSIETFVVNTSALFAVSKLYLNHNKIVNVTKESFMGLVNLRELYLNNNNIALIGPETFTSVHSLNILDISFNTELVINNTNFDNLSSLTEVSLQNTMVCLSFEQSTNLSIVQLDVSFAEIESINSMFIFNVEKVETLNFKNNKITYLDKSTFQSMPSLTSLDLSFNMISVIQPGSFRFTNSLKHLNLYDNELSSLKFGVLDGLKVLETLNLSNNALHEFSSNLLHSTPCLSSISLDDNVISQIRFYDFNGTSVKSITIGGNPIACHIFVKLKTAEYSFLIGAESLDYHSENVDGIKCKSDPLITANTNSTDINSTAAFLAFSNVIEKFQSSMKVFISSLNKIAYKNATTNIDIGKDKAFSKTLEKLVQSNDVSQNITNSYLKDLRKLLESYKIDSQNNKSELKNLSESVIALLKNSTISHESFIQEHLKYMKNATSYNNKQVDGTNISNNKDIVEYNLQRKIDALNEELNEKHERMKNELQMLFEGLKNNQNNIGNENETGKFVSNAAYSYDDVKSLLYVVVISLFIIAIAIVAFVYYEYKSKANKMRTISFHSSTQPIANIMELQDS